jgi:hypothetical protein
MLAIFEDSKHASRCRSCGRPIVWAELVNGSHHPFDAPIQTQPAAMLFELPRRIEDVSSDSHFATCPNAAQHRKAHADTR